VIGTDEIVGAWADAMSEDRYLRGLVGAYAEEEEAGYKLVLKNDDRSLACYQRSRVYDSQAPWIHYAVTGISLRGPDGDFFVRVN
jgi:hypothetical protein